MNVYRLDRVVGAVAPESVRPKLIGGPVLRPSWEHQRISKARADRDRVSKAELERALFVAGLASSGEQSAAARVIGVTEGALRHWRDQSMTRCLPPRTAIVALRNHRQKPSQERKVAGVK